MSKRLRFFLVLLLLGIGVAFLFPSFNWYYIFGEDEHKLALFSNEKIRDYTKELAEDRIYELKQLAIEDRYAPFPEDIVPLIDDIKEIMVQNDRDVPEIWTVNYLNDYLTESDVLDFLQETYRLNIESIKEVRNSIITQGLDLRGGIKITIQVDFESLAEKKQEDGYTLTEEDKLLALNSTLEIINQRVDQFGLLEPVIRREGEDRIIIELPGAADPERIRSVIMGRGSLDFHIVNDEAMEKFNVYRLTNSGPYLMDDNETIIDPELEELLGDNVILRKYYTKDNFGIEQFTGEYFVLEKEPGLEGERIVDASRSYDPTKMKPDVTFRLDSKGTQDFSDLTSNNVDNTLAVLLDNKIKAYANISEAITGGSVRVSGFNSEEAVDLATLLKTGSLPVELEIISQEAIGASLGEDTIEQGLKAIFLGLMLVMIFMIVYYKGGGIISCFGLLVNFFLMAGVLSVFNFTLTLPSIAGFILTLGMAVDANVIIFERIKEEYRLGKTRGASIISGFRKAFWTIMDANITTGIAALTLAWFGRGPIQGFAVVLAIGVVCSMISALIVSRLIFDFNTEVLKFKRLSISWRRVK